MKRGIILPQFDAGSAELLGAARLAEDSGLDSVWVFDTMWGVPDRRRPVLESWTSLSAVAAATSRLTVGTLVSRITLRNRRVLLSMAATVQMVAAGRMILGLGVGDSQSVDELRAYGLPYPPLSQRAAELGRHLDLFGAELPDLPVWIGGGHSRIMELIPRAAGWNYWGAVDGFIRRLDRARELAGDREVALSWGGPRITARELEQLAELGADHAVVAAGTSNYREKIRMLASV